MHKCSAFGYYNKYPKGLEKMPKIQQNLVNGNTFAIALRAIVLVTGWRTAIKAIIAALVMVKVVLAKAVSKKGIVLGLSKVFSNTLTILAIFGIYARSTTISTIKITVVIVC